MSYQTLLRKCKTLEEPQTKSEKERSATHSQFTSETRLPALRRLTQTKKS